MKKIISITLLVLSVLVFNSCEDDVTEFDYVGFEAKTFIFGIDIDGENTRDLNVYTSTITSSDRTFNLSVVEEGTTADQESYTIPATVTVPANSNKGIITMTVKDINIGSDGKELILQLSTDSDTFTGENITISLEQVCPNNGVKVKIGLSFDSWPPEAAWRIFDSAGNVVLASADPFNYGAYGYDLAGSSIEVKECLPSGEYTIQIFDGYADGGTDYTITANGVLVFSVSGNYGGYVEETFTI